MIQILTKEQAAERGLFTKDPITGKQVPFTTWRIEVPKEQKEAEQKQIAAGILPF